ncbi:hypothetical protein CALCODRAFT_329099 [Calocera cornea HHB12733]|uniref:Uncharacterized protein n=1 Tax=Calocera cornea HHB12733 TaxID=1353952 RepID=A0A165JIR8_9BASI|nr:hypothetical protein CALCODRAFT_329099 [Calocera cornea HHB12733]
MPSPGPRTGWRPAERTAKVPPHDAFVVIGLSHGHRSAIIPRFSDACTHDYIYHIPASSRTAPPLLGMIHGASCEARAQFRRERKVGPRRQLGRENLRCLAVTNGAPLHIGLE